MKRQRIKIETDDFSELLELVKAELDSYSGKYINQSCDMVIIAVEEFKLRTTSSQINMIVLKSKNGYILADIIGAAGGSGLFNWDWGSEKQFIKQLNRVIIKYCESHAISFEILED